MKLMAIVSAGLLTLGIASTALASSHRERSLAPEPQKPAIATSHSGWQLAPEPQVESTVPLRPDAKAPVVKPQGTRTPSDRAN